MVYIASDGTVHQSQPWGVKKFVDTLLVFLDSVGFFVQTLLPFQFEIPRLSNRAIRSSSSGAPRNNFQPGNRPAGPSNRRGGFRTMSDILPPPPTSACGGGGCSGGSCG